MSQSFLFAAYKRTLRVPDNVMSQIKMKSRHHFCQSDKALNVGDVVIVEAENSKHELVKKKVELLITTKDVVLESPKQVVVYGFVSIEDMPDALHDLISRIYETNGNLTVENAHLRAQVMEGVSA